MYLSPAYRWLGTLTISTFNSKDFLLRLIPISTNYGFSQRVTSTALCRVISTDAPMVLDLPEVPAVLWGPYDPKVSDVSEILTSLRSQFSLRSVLEVPINHDSMRSQTPVISDVGGPRRPSRTWCTVPEVSDVFKVPNIPMASDVRVVLNIPMVPNFPSLSINPMVCMSLRTLRSWIFLRSYRSLRYGLFYNCKVLILIKSQCFRGPFSPWSL